jgi:hypothetical protein
MFVSNFLVLKFIIMKKISKKIVIIFLLLFLLIFSWYLVFNYKYKSNIWINKIDIVTNTWSNLWPFNTKDEYIQKIDDSDQNEALRLALDRYEKNKWNDLWDYEQLMYIYIDLWEYDKVINIWKQAMILFKEHDQNDIWLKQSLLSMLIQAYLYKWDLNSAEYLFSKYNDIEMFFEKLIYEYKKWNYDYLINNYEKIKKDKIYNVTFELDLLAKSYIKKWDINNAIKIYEEIFSIWESWESEDALLSTYDLYISSFILKDLYSKNWDVEKSNFYNSKFLEYKKRIDNAEEIKYREWEKDPWLKFNKDSMYFIINRQINL